MSYPSIHRHLEAQGATVDTASEAQLRQAFIGAFHTDLSLGFAKVIERVDDMQDQNGRVVLTLDPDSEEGEQFARLIAPDIPRQILEGHFGCAFGFYDACKGTVASDRDGLKMTLKEQINEQQMSAVA